MILSQMQDMGNKFYITHTLTTKVENETQNKLKSGHCVLENSWAAGKVVFHCIKRFTIIATDMLFLNS